ncbi:hypothetical protein ACHAPA_011576 [Fusarium lateritium]
MDYELTLFLWMEGFFPKQVVYYLLIKGLADSPAQLYEGKTNDPRLRVNVLSFNGAKMEDANSEDQKPVGKSTPCLRIVDVTGKTPPRWVHESVSIRGFLEEMYPERPSMISPTPFGRAITGDIHSTVLQAFIDCNYYIKNAASVTTSWSGLKDEDRSLEVARLAKSNMVQSLLKAQEWAAESLKTGGWLTPELSHPGLADVTLAGGVRYMELSYSLGMLDDIRLELLRRWYARFQKLSWWKELEESGRHPKALVYSSDCREV